jgi:hypothetical protein
MTKLFGGCWSGQQDSNLHQPIDLTTSDSDRGGQQPPAARPRPGCDSDTRTLIGALALGAAFLALLVSLAMTARPCQPGDGDIYIGGMLMAGCPR